MPGAGAVHHIKNGSTRVNSRGSIFKKGCTILLDDIIAWGLANVRHVFGSKGNEVSFVQRQVLSSARIAVENSDVAILGLRFDDHPHSINSAINNAAVLPRFNVE